MLWEYLLLMFLKKGSKLGEEQSVSTSCGNREGRKLNPTPDLVTTPS
jgi:hypothetical protein